MDSSEANDSTPFGDYHRYQNRAHQQWTSIVTIQVLRVELCFTTSKTTWSMYHSKLVNHHQDRKASLSTLIQPVKSRIKPNHPEILPVVQKWKDVHKSNQLCIFEMLRSRQGMKWAAPSAIYKFMQPPPPHPPWLLLRPLQISLPWMLWWIHCNFLTLFWSWSMLWSLSMVEVELWSSKFLCNFPPLPLIMFEKFTLNKKRID